MANTEDLGPILAAMTEEQLVRLITQTNNILETVTPQMEKLKGIGQERYTKFCKDFQVITTMLTQAECELFKRKNRG